MNKQGWVTKIMNFVNEYILKNTQSNPIPVCTLGTNGDLWGPMGTYADQWGPLGTFGPLRDPWGPMGTYCGLWGPMGTYGDLWGPVGTYGYVWGPLGHYGDLWGPMGSSGHLWEPMQTYGGLWGPLGTYMDLWGRMGTYGDFFRIMCFAAFSCFLDLSQSRYLFIFLLGGFSHTHHDPPPFLQASNLYHTYHTSCCIDCKHNMPHQISHIRLYTQSSATSPSNHKGDLFIPDRGEGCNNCQTKAQGGE